MNPWFSQCIAAFWGSAGWSGSTVSACCGLDLGNHSHDGSPPFSESLQGATGAPFFSHAPYRINAGGAKAHLHGNLGMPSGQLKRLWKKRTRDGPPEWKHVFKKSILKPPMLWSQMPWIKIGWRPGTPSPKKGSMVLGIATAVSGSLTVSFRISCLLYITVFEFAKHFLTICYLACLLSFNSLLILLIFLLPCHIDLTQKRIKIRDPSGRLSTRCRMSFTVSGLARGGLAANAARTSRHTAKGYSIQWYSMHGVPSHIPCLMHKDATQTMSQPWDSQEFSVKLSRRRSTGAMACLDKSTKRSAF